MAKKSITSWDGVNKALKEIGDCATSIEVIEAELSVKLNDAQEKASKLAAPLKEKAKLLEEQVRNFTENNIKDLEGKSKKLNFGQVGFRKSVKTELTANVDEIIKLLKKFKMTDCIEVKETVNKNNLKKYSDQELEKVRVKRVAEENFFIKIMKGKVQD